MWCLLPFNEICSEHFWSRAKRRIKLWSPLELTVLVEPRIGARWCCTYLLYSRRYSCLFSCLFNNVSRDATLALSGVLCSQLGDDAGSHDAPASVWWCWSTWSLLPFTCDCSVSLSGVQAGCKNTNVVPYVVRYHAEKLVPCVSAEMSLCTVSTLSKPPWSLALRSQDRPTKCREFIF